MASELDLLKSNREDLVAKIRHVKPFLDRLFQHDEIVKEDYDNVVAEKTPQDQARALLDIVEVKGRGAFRHFREHLKKVNPELEDVLHRCSKHNLRLKLYCEECGSLLCVECRSLDHTGHRCSSLVADGDVIRREVTAFYRENRRLLIERNKGPGSCDTKSMRKEASDRAKALKEKLCAKVDEDYCWFLGQLGDDCVTLSPSLSVSSIAESRSRSESETDSVDDTPHPFSDSSATTPKVMLNGEDMEPSLTEFTKPYTARDDSRIFDIKESSSVQITARAIGVPPHQLKQLPTVEWLYSVGIWNFENKLNAQNQNVHEKQSCYQEMLATHCLKIEGGLEGVSDKRVRSRTRSLPARRSSGTY
ncbi:uncharacterized protein [Branchiostoma lanceolatum]|uniref:uncharacterized protein n=1 Tax=Branchiostoma lanceolatum TaxID=7740 RepID=UPI00345725AA